MAARKEIVRNMVAEGMSMDTALALAEIPRSSYYYKPTGKRKGKAPSSRTIKNGNWVEDSLVVEAIKKMLGQDFIDYGYIRTTAALKQQGYIINKKKVYRLMKEQNLLYKKTNAASSPKEYVELTVPLCSRPFEIIELDIKYIYIQGLRRHAYLITMLDVFSRAVLVWDLGWTMKAEIVVDLVNKLLKDWLIPLNADPRELSVKIRTDNGSQFIAKKFREHLLKSTISNEYIRPATPQQNGHIESFHNTLTRLVCHKYSFDDIYQAQEVLERFITVYNEKRIMKSILYMTPMKFLQKWAEGHIITETKNKRNNYFFREEPRVEKSLDSSSEDSFVHFKDIEKINRLNNHSPI